MKRGALRLSVSTSPVARRTQVSPLHSIPPRFRDEESASSSDDDNDAVDTNLEEDLLVEIRSRQQRSPCIILLFTVFATFLVLLVFLFLLQRW